MPADIVAFAKDWDDTTTSNHHVLRELAKTRRVLWLNSVATRTPKLGSRRDLGRASRKLFDFLKGPQQVESQLWVFTPLVLPLPHSRFARRLNARILRMTVRFLRGRLGIEDFQLWTFLPSVADYVGTLEESLAVYYCVDEWSMFSYIDTAGMEADERTLLERVDCVFAVNEALAARKREVNPESHASPHGVNRALFSRALDPRTRVPPELAALAAPVVGFIGTVQDWVDLTLIAGIAELRPEWSIAIIGRVLLDVAPLERFSNIHILGPRPHEALPEACKGFDVGIIPYRVSEQLPFRNPLKLREYLAAGLPLVSTAVPEVDRYERWCAVREDADGFAEAIEKALAEDTPELRQERSAAMRDETWEARVAEIARIVDEVAARKAGRADRVLVS